MDKKQREFQKDVNKIKLGISRGLEAVYTHSRKHAKMWGTEFVPVKMFDIIIDKSKLKENKQAEEEIKEFNKTLDALRGDLVNISTKNKSENIPLVNIRKGVNIVKVDWETKMDGYFLKDETKEG